jgi:hypothetical protein
VTGISQIKRCGGCHFGKMFGQDLTKRICWGMPPFASQTPAPNGQMTLRMVRPVVSVSDEACALWADKNADDKARDSTALQALQMLNEQGVTPPTGGTQN